MAETITWIFIAYICVAIFLVGGIFLLVTRSPKRDKLTQKRIAKSLAYGNALYKGKLDCILARLLVPKHILSEKTEPKEPMRRRLTAEEQGFMHKNYMEHGWSHVDALGRIILNGGEESGGIFYLKVEELEKFLKDVKKARYKKG